MNLDTCTRVHPYKSRYVAILILGLYVNRQNNCAMSEKGETENIQGQRHTKGVRERERERERETERQRDRER